MKNIKYIGITLVMTFVAFACDDYLDVNKNPSSPTSLDGSISARLPWIQEYYLLGQSWGGNVVSNITQQLTSTESNFTGASPGWRNTYGWYAGWNPPTYASFNLMPYQYFFVGAGGNFVETNDKAEKEGAYHYQAAIKVIRAVGFMLMTDLYGEMPYIQAIGGYATPKLDDGKTIFEGCLKEIDEAIALFSQPQAVGATSFAKGDIWNDGDVNKWIKLCYGLKARWLNNLSKKSALYDPDAILAALAKAPQSNADNTIVKHENSADDISKDIYWDENGLKISPAYAGLGGDAQHRTRVTKWYTDMLTDFDGKGIVDPRADKLIPSAQFGGANKYWKRSEGVDMQSDIRIEKGPAATSYNATTKAWTAGTRPQDTVYVSLQAKSLAKDKVAVDEVVASDGTVTASGTFYTRPDSPTHFLCYPEMCFIKAEVLFRKGDKPGAFAAYKEGIQAHIELMNQKLTEYGATANPAKKVMETVDIDNFLNNAIGDASNLTIGKIMTQKFIALSFTVQNWNDMRRYDYSTEAYPGWAIPYEYNFNADAKKYIPAGSQFRRFASPIRESMYNPVNVAASHPHALLDDIYSFPVWWDIAE